MPALFSPCYPDISSFERLSVALILAHARKRNAFVFFAAYCNVACKGDSLEKDDR